MSGALRMAVAFAALWWLGGPAAAAPVEDDPPAEEPTGDPSDELPDRARTIIGSPDPGPKPEDAGDRGGWAQLLLLGVLVIGVGFVAWRITRAVRGGPATDLGGSAT